MHGAQCREYGAVALFTNISRDTDEMVHHLPEFSSSHVTSWARIGTFQYWGAFIIPPRRRGSNESLRMHLVKRLFVELDNVTRSGHRSYTGAAAEVWLAGDLNPGEDILELFEQLFRDRKLVRAYDQGTPTHIAGRTLDEVVGPVVAGLPTVSQVMAHNGLDCKLLDCTREGCGALW